MKKVIIWSAIVVILFSLWLSREFIIDRFGYSPPLTKPDFEFVKANQWQYDNGYRIGEGDFLEFNDSTDRFSSLRNDTILINGLPRGRVVRLNRARNKITISSLANGQTGIYINSEEFTK
jgi:hypothetical protein